MRHDRVYLDCNATCPVHPKVIEAVAQCLHETGNPSSVHHEGRHAKGLIERTRRHLDAALDADGAAIYFTSGATEANNWALAGHAGPLLASSIEHPSILDAARGCDHVPVLGDGTIDLQALDGLLATERPALVAVMAANNETGIIQPLAETARLCNIHQAKLHIDAVQALGKIPVSFRELGCHSMSVSAHKMGGPPGVGALIVDADHDIEPMIRGGGQEHRKRSGTENLSGIVGFGTALETLDQTLIDQLGSWHRQFETEIIDQISGTAVVGNGMPRLANTSCIILDGVRAETALMSLDLDGIAVSSGAACSSGKVAASHVLKAMGLSADRQQSAIRISSGWANRAGDFKRLRSSLTKLAERIHQGG